jgi:hypothetical protein
MILLSVSLSFNTKFSIWNILGKHIKKQSNRQLVQTGFEFGLGTVNNPEFAGYSRIFQYGSR